MTRGFGITYKPNEGKTGDFFGEEENDKIVEIEKPLFESRVNSFQIKDIRNYLHKNYSWAGDGYIDSDGLEVFQTNDSKILIKNDGEERGKLGYKLRIFTHGPIKKKILNHLEKLVKGEKLN